MKKQKFFKKLKKIFKRIALRFKYKFKPSSLTKKQRKKVRKEKKIKDQYSGIGNWLRWVSGCKFSANFA